jgi:NDP-4-keto-2,6-dideoxyhexose 3-C-methyltransferase
MTQTYVIRTACRLCGDERLDEILGLGELAFSAFPQRGELLVPARAPLTLCLCRACGLAQLRETVAPAFLYRQYWYRSSINEVMREELQSIVRAALLEVSVYSGRDLVMDVGANDGYLLSQYPQHRINWDVERIAFEPAANLEGDCRRHCEIFSAELFPPPLSFRKLSQWAKRVKILTSIAMFYDLDDPGAFVRAVDELLHPDGVWIVQLQDLAQMVGCTAFDNLCHEHLTYWSLAAFETLLRGCGVDLHVVKAERRAINGGSLRIFIRRTVHAQDPTVEALTGLERPAVDWQALERFAWNTSMIRRQIQGIVGAEAAAGKTIDLYGASTKANTLLQYCQLGPETIRQAWERNVEKLGRLTATGIPIVSEQVGRNDPPQLLLVGIWQFREGILGREAEYLAAGGTLLFPLPEVDLVRHAPDPA